MIELTRLNGSTIVINAELIETVESTPDTVLTLITGRKLIVRDTVTEIVDSVVSYRRSVGVWRDLVVNNSGQELEEERAEQEIETEV